MTIGYQEVRARLLYSPDTGEFHWKDSYFRSAIGTLAGSVDKDGYIAIRFGGKCYRAHRLAWLYVYGAMPNGVIDHINGVRDDNRICNLRDVTHSVNSQNRRKPSRVQSVQHLGVTYSKNRWVARIFSEGRRIHLGRFVSPELAADAYAKAKKRLHRIDLGAPA